MEPNYVEYSDEKLAALLKTGDRLAFKEIFERFYGLLLAHAYRRLEDEDWAKDLIQELFENIWFKREQILLTGSFSSYLYASVRNRILNDIAHKKVEQKYLESLSDFIDKDEYYADFLIREQQLSELIEKEIDALPPRMREIFILSRKEYLSNREIAERLNLSELTVKSQIKNALRIIRPRISTIAFLYLLFRL